jgi:hypothetical protein
MSTPINPPVSPAPPTPPTTPAPRSRKTLYAMVAVVVVVVVILIAFIVLPTLTSSGSGATGALTYSGARPIADRTMSGFQGGGWTLLFAAGLVTPTSESIPTNTSALGNLSASGCSYRIVTGANSYTVPSFTGNRSSGAASAWEFGYRNGTDALAIASVINGSGSVIATITGTECAFFAQLLVPIPGNVIDSSTAAADVRPYAASFLTAHPNASAEFALLGGASLFGKSTPAEWSVIYTTCAVSPTSGGTGEQFNATVNGLTQAVSGVTTNTNAACGNTTVTAASPVPGTPVAAPLSGAPVLARPSETG